MGLTLPKVMKGRNGKKYQAALKYITKLHIYKEESKKKEYLWREPEMEAYLDLPQLTICSLLQKGVERGLGQQGRRTLLSAMNPSIDSLTNYIQACKEKNSIEARHFKLQQMHVNWPVQNTVLNDIIQFGVSKNLLP